MNPAFMSDINALEGMFWFAALVGTVFFGLRVVMMFLGADGHDDGGGDVSGGDYMGGDFDAGHAGHATHTDTAFQMISVNTLTAFVMMFGWSGLTCYKQFALGATQSVIIALFVGLLCMFITGHLMKMTHALTSKGAVFDINKSIGMKGSVYQKIPARGKGRIQVSVPGSNQRELDAVSALTQDIDSFKTVEITAVIDGNTVAVKEIL